MVRQQAEQGRHQAGAHVGGSHLHADDGLGPVAPKSAGVEWMTQGYTGAQPSPMMIRPASAAFPPRGRKKIRMPARIRARPSRIICVSLKRRVRKPLAARPAVMPMKNRLAKKAAASVETPSCSAR